MSVKLSEELQWRGFYNQATFLAPEELDERHYTLYLGTDPSGDSLHVGHLAVYMLVRRFLDHGHDVVLLVGGGTGVIGDPGGKENERQLLSLETIAGNKVALAAQVTQLFSGKEFTLVDNYDWLKDVSVLEFLRDVGKYFSMSQLVQRDFIATRIGEGGAGISYAEFSYTLLQGYDFWHLHTHHDVNLQVGGSDQWGNILSGIELIRKKNGDTAYGMTAPLVINKSTGRKFGKSEGGAVWLDPAKTSVYKFYQFWLNTDDESVIDYMKLFTLLDKPTIEQIAAEQAAAPHTRVAQKRLAREITTLVHGEARARAAEHATEILFGGEVFDPTDEQVVAVLQAELPVTRQGQTVVDALIDTGVLQSKGEARRLIAGGAISVDGQKLAEDRVLTQPALIKKGKNVFVVAL